MQACSSWSGVPPDGSPEAPINAERRERGGGGGGFLKSQRNLSMIKVFWGCSQGSYVGFGPSAEDGCKA